ncbi:hypothetical protein JD844_017832 [Phrynosoma platyrhinos]|uniref:Fibronectin type-III domain-containing protein n=1 Tax=Phrynosoma platyrhinos TaxID=52577 RepID=A0ABQ7SMN3_PHRPL|nr:hypothetical protein JD844_017832 [Phrynosoma platyrhinos]
MTDKGQLKISWSSPASKSYPLQYEVKCFANSSKSVWQVIQITMETSLIMNNALFDSSYEVQVRCKRLYGSGLWSDWSTPYSMNLQGNTLLVGMLASVGTNVSFYCIYKTKDRIISSRKIVWWLNLAKEIPRSQYTLVNDYVGKVTLINLSAMKPGGKFLFNALYCCNENKECNHRYAELYIIDVNISITCETDGNLQKMTCRWSTNRDPLLSESTLLLRYYRSDVYCSETPTMPSYSEVKECQPQRNNSYECIFQPFYLLSGYTMWIEIKHSLGTVTSKPVCILPKEVVKPFSPSNVKAEITGEVGLLNVSWNNPELPKNDLHFQIRYAVNGTEINWEMQEISTPSISSAAVVVQDLCAVYIVQVRCSVTDGVGYWSDWSRSAYTVVKDIKAPLRGPEFWRVVKEDSVKNQKNVTLFWKPETFEHLFLKHPEALSFGPLLLEPEIVLEDVTIDKARNNEDKQDLLAVDSLFATFQDFEHDSACSSGHFNSESLSESVHDVETRGEMTGQSNVKYATIISNSISSGLYEPPKDLSSSFDRGFIDHDSLVPPSFSSTWALGSQAFVILPECDQKFPRKTLSVSVVSSEGFSEPSEQDRTFIEEDSLERNMFYLGMSSFKRHENDLFLTENSNLACHFHTSALVRSMRFPQNMASNLNLNPFISRHETSVQTFIPYMPQFQTLAIKLHEKAGSKA